MGDDRPEPSKQWQSHMETQWGFVLGMCVDLWVGCASLVRIQHGQTVGSVHFDRREGGPDR